MLILPLLPDTKQGDEALAKWKADVEARVKLRPTVESGAAVSGLDRITGAAEKTAKASEGALSRLNAQAAVAALGPLKEIVSKVGEGMLGLSAETTKAATAAADMAAKGGQLGSIFGPVGTAIGAVTGAITGWIWAAEEAAKAEVALTKTLEAESQKRQEIAARELRSSMRAASAVTDGLDDLASEYDEINSKINKASEKAAFGALGALTLTKEEITSAKYEFASAQKALEDFLRTPVEFDRDPAKKAEQEADLKRKEAGLRDAVEEAQYAAAQLTKEANKSFREADKILGEAATKADHLAASMTKAKAATVSFQEGNAGTITTNVGDLRATDQDRRSREARVQADRLELQQRTDAAMLASAQATATQEQLILNQKTAQLQAYGAVAQSVLSSIGGAIENNIANEQRLLAGVGAAAEGALGAYLKTKAREFLVAGLGEVAAGWAALGSVALAPTAPMHFYSAAQYGVAAAAAGGAGIALSGDAGRRQGARDEGSAGGAGGGSAPTAGRISDPGPTASMTPIVINFQSTVPHTEREQQEAASRIQALLDKRRSR